MLATNLPLNSSSTTLPADLTTGMIRWDQGKKYILVKNVGASLADGKTFKRDANSTTDIHVIVGAARGDYILGVNNTGAAIPDGSYFWGLQEGRGYSIGSTIAVNVEAEAGAAGVVAEVGSGGRSIGICLVANSNIQWSCPGGYNG